jgi:hypothetical protein
MQADAKREPSQRFEALHGSLLNGEVVCCESLIIN